MTTFTVDPNNNITALASGPVEQLRFHQPGGCGRTDMRGVQNHSQTLREAESRGSKKAEVIAPI